MNLVRKVLNSKVVDRFRRNLALSTGIYCKVKKLAPTVSEELRTAKLLNHFGITQVIDVGANTGQFAEGIIDFGYKGKVISFEPVSSAFQSLSKRVNKYPQWEAYHAAIGNIDGQVDINVSEDTQFSSIKNIKEDFTETLSAARTIRKEVVDIHRLDSLIGKYFEIDQPTLLKIDTQGFEKEVMEGAAELIKSVKGLKLEIPLAKNLEIYNEIEWDIVDYISMFAKMGFTCMSLDTINADKTTGIVYEVDGIFIRQ